MLLQLDSWKILYVLCVFTLVNELVLITWLQHRLRLVLHGEQNLATFLLAFFLRTLLLMIVLLPIISRRFLHRLNAMIGGSENSFLSLGFMFSISHLSLRILPIWGSVELNVSTRGILVDRFLRTFFSVVFLGVMIAFRICSWRISLWYPRRIKLSSICLQLLFNSLSFVQILLSLSG